VAIAIAKTAPVKCANANSARQHDAIKTADVDAANTPSVKLATERACAACQSLLQKK